MPVLPSPYAAHPATLRPRLIPLHGGPAIEVVQPLTVVGRRHGCDVRLEGVCVSKVHCALVWTNGMLLLRDLGSCNGTRVNGARIHEAVLNNGDQIDLAGCRFDVRLEREAHAPADDADRTYCLN